MNQNAAEILKRLLKKGWIDRKEDSLIWHTLEDEGVLADLEVLKSTLCFDTLQAGDRFYLIPTQDNELFLKNNIDYKRDIKSTNDTRTKDLYLLNYLAIYILYLFFRGEGSEPQCREFIQKSELILKFTEHCQKAENAPVDEKDGFSESFVGLARDWLSKIDGPPDSVKVTTEKNGVVNKILQKFRADELFDEQKGIIRPTRKLTDLMPYWLRKDRIKEIDGWIEEVEHRAANQ